MSQEVIEVTEREVEVVEIIERGPAGPAGTGLETLTTQGDILYQGLSSGQRLPIGTAGQILKVNSGETAPEWGEAPATGVTSVGVTGSDGIEVDSGSPVTESGSIALGVNAATLRSHINVADGANNYTHPNHSGEVTSSGDGATTISNDVVTNAKLANVATSTIKGRATAGTGDPEDLTATQVRTILNVADGAEVNVQSNWTEADSGSDAFILNKPTLGTAAAQDANQDLNTTSDVEFASVNAKLHAGESNTIIVQSAISFDDIHSEDIEATTRSNLGLGTAATSNVGDFAAASHTHAASDITSGTLTHERGGLEADVSAYNGLVKISGGSTSAVTLSSAGEALLDDADAAAQRTTLGLGTVASSNSYTDLDNKPSIPSALNDLSNVSAATPNDNDVLVYDNATSTWVAEAPAAGGVSAIGTSAADVLSVSGSDLVADDGGTIDSADPFIKWDDTNSKLVYANPLSRPDGSFYIGSPPTTTPLGTDALNIQTGRSNATYLAKDAQSTCIGYNARSTSSTATAVGYNSTCGNGSAAYGHSSNAGNDSAAFGYGANASSGGAVAVGRSPSTAFRSIAIGYLPSASGQWSAAVGGQVSASLRAQFATRPFNAVYWSGTTNDATPTSLNLDGIATNKFSISANRAYFVDISLIARRSDTQDKWLVARRFLGIRRDGSNNTSLIGSVQTIGTDQSDGSPTWTFSLTADDVGDNLELEVVGAVGETVEWTATAFFRAT